MTDTNTEQKMIADIKQLLDADMPDIDTRAALQQARIRALTDSEKHTQRKPWLEFAVAASLVAVVVANLPQSKNDVQSTATTPIAQKTTVSTSTKTVATLPPDKPKSPSAVRTQTTPVTSQASAIDIDLLENLDLYEDPEFYEWLSEQEAQGGIDA